MNRLEELGRVDAEKAKTKMGKRNLRDEKSRIIRELKAKGGTISGNKSQKKKFRPTKSVKPKAAGSKGKYYREFADGGKIKKLAPGITKSVKKIMDRSAAKNKDLKKVQPNQKGLKKLPRQVRNKMGYMKKGGKVGMGKAMRGGGCVR
jgi:hypothetical protein